MKEKRERSSVKKVKAYGRFKKHMDERHRLMRNQHAVQTDLDTDFTATREERKIKVNRVEKKRSPGTLV
jgi:hypothetical protein